MLSIQGAHVQSLVGELLIRSCMLYGAAKKKKGNHKLITNRARILMVSLSGSKPGSWPLSYLFCAPVPLVMPDQSRIQDPEQWSLSKCSDQCDSNAKHRMEMSNTVFRISLSCKGVTSRKVGPMSTYHFLTRPLNQRSPNPRPQTGTRPQPVRNWAAQQEVSGGRANAGTTAWTTPPHPWKNCLPRNRSLVPTRLGTADLNVYCWAEMTNQPCASFFFLSTVISYSSWRYIYLKTSPLCLASKKVTKWKCLSWPLWPSWSHTFLVARSKQVFQSKQDSEAVFLFCFCFCFLVFCSFRLLVTQLELRIEFHPQHTVEQSARTPPEAPWQRTCLGLGSS